MDEQKDGVQSHGDSGKSQANSESVPKTTSEPIESSKQVRPDAPAKPEIKEILDPKLVREVASSESSTPRRPARGLTLFVIIAILAVGVYTFVSKSSGNDDQKIQAKVALSEKGLKDLVASKKLTVYWAGPLEGAKYTINATTPGIVFLKYIPKGVDFRDPKVFFRTIGTYSMQNAFSVTKGTGALKGNVGFTTADGYSAFYSLSRPTNIYLGVKKLNLQIEIFDAHADQALGLARVQGQIRKIA